MPPLIPQYHPPPKIEEVAAGLHYDHAHDQEQPVNYVSSLEIQPRQDYNYHSQEQLPGHYNDDTDDQEQPPSVEIKELKSNEVNIDKDKVNFPQGNPIILTQFYFFLCNLLSFLFPNIY